MHPQTVRTSIDGVVTVTPATEADVAEVNATMRKADRDEIIGDGFCWDDCKEAYGAWSVRVDGDLMCVIGTTKVFFEDTELSRTRQFFMLSTENVWRHKVAFVRHSPMVAEFVLEQQPEWVDSVWSFPKADYTGSLKWQERVLGFRKIGTFMVGEDKFAIMERRKGVRNGVG